MKTLRTKLIFWICLLFCSIGLFIYLSLSVILPQKLSGQILKRDIKIAQYLSREVQELVLVNNKLALKLLLKDRLENMEDVIYIFIRGRDKGIIASTFKAGFPRGLLNINEEAFQPLKSGGESYSVERFLVKGEKAYDIAVPLIKGELGSLHVGVSLESSKKEIAAFSNIKYYVAVVIFIGLGIGILIFATFGIFLSSRIIKLKNFAARIGRGDLDGSINIKTGDEIESLAEAFNEMAVSLKEKIQEINRLNIVKERDRIAFDLHDGCAQNIADIIKRLEFCEKLFKSDPARTFEELKVLKENTKAALNKTRKVIYDLKLPEDANFDLPKGLKSFIITYQKENDIKVELNTRGFGNEVPADTARQAFYIIEETLNNVKKHSLADHVKLDIESNAQDGLNIDIEDNGRGFSPDRIRVFARESGKWGLASMRQRAVSLGGSMVVDSAPGKGTRISIKIPHKKEKGDSALFI